MHGENLRQKTNLRHLAVTLIELLNDRRGILRSDVQHIILYLSYSIKLKVLILELAQSLPRLTQMGKIGLLRTFMIIYLTHGDKEENKDIFEEDSNLLLTIVYYLTEVFLRKEKDLDNRLGSAG